MPLTDPSTWNPDTGQGIDPLKNAHDKENLTDECPGDFPGYDSGTDFLNNYESSPNNY